MMEGSQLDLNQPFLTVRRSTGVSLETQEKRKNDKTTANLPPLPKYKSELKSGPVRNPGTVPFVWEQSPGRPKDGGKLVNPTLNSHPAVPKPPPGRNPKRQDLNRIRNEVTDKEQNYVLEDESTLKCERINAGIDEKLDSGSEIDDEAYLDALDTFSWSESLYLTCSVSGQSGVDSLDSRLSGRFSRDPPARDFMMGRFLPAAKAMASEKPANISRRPQLETMQPRHLTNALDVVKNTQRYQRKLNVPIVNDRYGLGEDSEDDYDEYENPSAKLCGLLQRICPLNAVSSVGVHTTRSTPSLRRMQAKPCARHQVETLCRQDRDSTSMQKSARNFSSGEQHADKPEPKAVYSHSISESEGKILEATSLYKLMQSGGVAKLQDDSPQTERMGLDDSIGHRVVVEDSRAEGPFKQQERHCMNFRQLLASEGAEWESRSKVPVIEKTVHVDSVQMVESQDSDTSFSDRRRLSESVSDDGEDLKNSMTSKRSVDDASVDSSLVDITNLNIAQKSSTPTPSAESAKSADSSPLPSSDGLDGAVRIDMVNGSKYEGNFTTVRQTEMSSIDDGKRDLETCSIIDGKIDLESEITLRSGDPSFLPGIYTDFPIPPPLPKSPSDSWLLRTLPSISSKSSGLGPKPGTNAFSRVHASSRSSPLVDPKWETIVKTSHLHHSHLRFSEELLSPIPESCTEQ